MIEMIADLPDNVVGFSAAGKLTAEDYENVLIPAVEAAFDRHDRVRLLYHLGENFDGFEPGAAWDDMKVGLRHLRGWERIALVTDLDWLRNTLRAFAVVMPGELRVFDNQQMQQAIDWVTELDG